MEIYSEFEDAIGIVALVNKKCAKPFCNYKLDNKRKLLLGFGG